MILWIIEFDICTNVESGHPASSTYLIKMLIVVLANTHTMCNSIAQIETRIAEHV